MTQAGLIPVASSSAAADRPPPTGKADLRMGRATGRLFWTVDTLAGRIQGIANGAIKQFKGIPYGASTAGAGRYRSPRPAEPWTGVRDCFAYGQVSPQVPMDLNFEYAMLINWDSHVGPGGLGEDCLNLNVWTPGLEDDVARPVMVAIHGGGWTTGSGNGPMYDGALLAKTGDVVVVTVNHRLGALGYAHFADLGAPDDFHSAGVCGLQDLVLALEWVRDNIGRFGGDPGRVTIFGQSGGGSKVSALMATPSARGLFHRAVVQSRPAVGPWTPPVGSDRAEQLLTALGLDRSRIADIRSLPWERILEAQAELGDFRPVLDGAFLPHIPFDPAGPPHSSDVPMIIGTTLHDRSNLFENFDVDEAGVLKVFRGRWGDRAEALLAAYQAEAPQETPFLRQGRAWTDAERGHTILQAERKAAQGAAPAYLYVWDWASDAFDGRYGAFHAEDLDASFGLYRSPACGSARARGRLMVDRFCATLVAFARTGSPNNPLIPDWPAYDATRRATLVFDDEMRVVDDYRGDFVRLIGETGPWTVVT